MGCCKKEEDHEDENLGKGPIEKRECRDVLFLLLYAVFWVGMFIIAGYAYKNGDWRRLVYGIDSYGNVCGFNNTKAYDSSNSGLDMTNRPFLFYYNPASYSTSLKICVASCPTPTVATACPSSSCNGFCLEPPYNVSDAGSSDQSNSGCPLTVYRSNPVLHRCIPFAEDLREYVEASFDSNNVMQHIFEDFKVAAPRIMYMALMSLATAMLIVILMRCCAGLLIWSFVLSGMFAFWALTAFLWQQWQEKKRERETTGETDNEKTFKVLAAVSMAASVIVFLLVLVMRNRIRLCVAIFEEASKAMLRMPQVYITPILTYINLGILCVFMFFTFVFLATSGKVAEGEQRRAQYLVGEDYYKMWWYLLFGFLWTAQFILACGEITLAGMFAMWYFMRKTGFSSPLTKSIYRLIRYHLGSAAFGSLIIALIQFARMVLAYIQRKLKKKAGRIVKFLLCLLQCCLWCFEKFMKFINKNAYIEIAIYGYSFCKAARTAFMKLLRNILRVAAINTVGAFTLFMCKLLVVGLTGVCGIALLRNDDELNYYSLVVLFMCVLAWYIADCIIDIYKMGIDTIFLCFLEDSERNNGKDKPYFMSDNLLKFMKSGAKNQEGAEKADKQAAKEAAKEGEKNPPKYAKPPKE